jgi:uncharacterized membrane protein YdbT with pleckstrin-like domain
MPEQTIMKIHPARISYLKKYVVGAALIVLGLAAFLNLLPLAIPAAFRIYLLVLLLIGTVVIFFAEYARSTDTYLITSHRFVERVGTFSTHELYVEWDKVAQHAIHQSLLDKMLRVGTIEVKTVGGADAPEIYTKKIPHIRKVEQLMIDLIAGKVPEPPAPQQAKQQTKAPR